MAVDVIGDRAERGANAVRRGQERQRFRWGACGTISVFDAMPAARCAYMLAQQLSGLRIEQPDVQTIPLHLDAAPDPAWRRAVVRGVDFHAAIEVHGADAEAVITKRLERQ